MPGFTSGAICGRYVRAKNVENNNFGGSLPAAEIVLCMSWRFGELPDKFAFLLRDYYFVGAAEAGNVVVGLVAGSRVFVGLSL